MKYLIAPIIFSMIVVAGNVAAADLNGEWVGSQSCSNDYGATSENIDITINQIGDIFTTHNTSSQTCGGVLDGKKISISCPDYTIAYGELQGKTMYFINHNPLPTEGKTCKGSVTRTN